MKEKINEVLLGLSFLDEIDENQRLKDDLGFDSLSLSNLMLKLEEVFAIELQMEDLDPSSFSTVADVYKLVAKYV